MRFSVLALALACALAGAGIAAAQSTSVPFGALTHDTTAPVEVTAESLTVDQADGTAVFSGNVVISQGAMRITAAEVRVTYAEGNSDGRVERLEATGGVVLLSSAEKAEAREAVYTIDSGVIVLTGTVMLSQGRNSISAGKMTLNLKSGTAVLDGGVRTVLQPRSNP